MTFPDDKAIEALHKKYAPTNTAFRVVYEHCRIVDEITKELTKRNQLKLNTELVHAAALLHDIGYYPLLDESGYEQKGVGIKHGITGAEILRKEGVDETICRVAERHTGVGLTREGILKFRLPLPPRDFLAETPEEWLIMYADKLHTKAICIDDPHDVLGWLNAPRTYLKHARKFGEDNAVLFNELVKKYGVPDLEALAGRYGLKIK